MAVTEVGIETEERDLELWNTSPPMAVTDVGIVIEVRTKQLARIP
jgi:hypothetical protein